MTLLSLQPTLLATLALFFDERLTFSKQLCALSKSSYYHIREILRCDVGLEEGEYK